MPRHAVQQAYLDAQERVEHLCRVVDEAARPLNAQVDAGEITEDAWAEARNALDDDLGLTAATHARDAARAALIDWGLEQVELLWPTYGALFPNHSLESLRALFRARDSHRRLVPVILRLKDWA